MILHCTQCDINWARLLSVTADQDDYEVCPVCLTDTFLGDPTDIVSYFRCPITGSIINVETKEVLVPAAPVFKIPPPRPYPKETIEEREDREIIAIDAYIASGSESDYFNNIKKQKK